MRFWRPLLISLMLCAVVLGQNTKAPPKECPEGTVRSGGMATSGCLYDGGCYTPEEKAKADEWFAKCWCGESGLAVYEMDAKWQNGSGYSRSSVWKNHECVTTEKWLKLVKGKWSDITKEEYEEFTRKRHYHERKGDL